jgi:hypothetical protein
LNGKRSSTSDDGGGESRPIQKEKMRTGRLTYIACEHIEQSECTVPKHMEEVYQMFALPNNHILAVCDICYSIIVGEVVRTLINNAVKSARFQKGFSNA